MFVPLTQRGEITGISMTGRAISRMLKKRVGQAGVEPLSRHDFRRTFIGDLLARGIDISRVKERAGHASGDTTARYDRRPEAERRRAIEVLRGPPLPIHAKAEPLSKIMQPEGYEELAYI